MAQAHNTDPAAPLDYAVLDHGRAARTGVPEVIFCPGKSAEQVVEIFGRIVGREGRALATRAAPETAAALCTAFPAASHHAQARTVSLGAAQPDRTPGYVAVVTGGTTDIPVAEEAAATLEFLGNGVERAYDVGVAGLHRVLGVRDLLDLAAAVIVVAGMEGALASVVGGLVAGPVIAVPTSVGYGASFGGLAALLAMLNSCAPGVTVVNIDNGFGAAVHAHQILNRLRARG